VASSRVEKRRPVASSCSVRIDLSLFMFVYKYFAISNLGQKSVQLIFELSRIRLRDL
jgi:hypothetical protein